MEYQPGEVQYCLNCETDYCGDCIQSTMERSYEGRLLAAMEPRFNAFMWEDVEKFKKYMGDDVDPVKHGIYQATHVALPFIEHQNSMPWFKSFTQEEAKMLYLANVAHDWHEGLEALNRGATTDVEAPKKTDEIYEAELELNLEVVKSILHPTDEWLQSYRAVVGDLKGWSHAGRAFNCIERCGYFLTGMKAWSMRNHEDLDDDERLKCREMGHATMTFNLPVLDEYSREFAYPGFLLRVNESVIRSLQ